MTEPESPYRLRQEFLSPAEAAFYHVLHELVIGKLRICPKVHLQDIFSISRPNENVHYFNKLNRKTIDFLLIDAVHLKPVIALELDHPKQQEIRGETDPLLDEICSAAGLPLLHITIQQTYDVRILAKRIRDAVYKNSGGNPEENRATDFSPICPNCGITMVLRFDREDGPFKGKKYYGCLNFPGCAHTIPVE